MIARLKGIAAAKRAQTLLLAAGVVLLYGVTRFSALDQFPIYFFCDEAIHGVLAEQLVENGFRDSEGRLFPPYFLNDTKYNLSLSVYMHAFSYALLGKSVVLTRATSAAVSLLGVLAVMLILRRVFQARLWWIGGLALAAVPTWFLHSRTAFEATMMAAFYACFLACYMLYRTGSPRFLLAALIFGAATFYSYANGQGLMLISAILLLLSDLRHHLRQSWHTIAGALLLLALLAWPYLRERALHPGSLHDHLVELNSYWVHPISLGEKLSTFGRTYLQGLDPRYWFAPEHQDQIRHVMKDMGRIPLIFLPFVALGLLVCLRRWRSSPHRVVLIALLAGPFSAAVAAIGITRMLAMIIPFTLLACLGLEQLAAWLGRWVSPRITGGVAGVGLAAMSLLMLTTSLRDGPFWYNDYAEYQWGAAQVFAAVQEELDQAPGATIYMSPNWANNPDSFRFYFLRPEQRDRLTFAHSIDSFVSKKTELLPEMLLILPPNEYQTAIASGKLIVDPPERVIAYPDGRPGFYFVRMRYVDNVDAIFAAEYAEQIKPVANFAQIDGEQVSIIHSPLGAGSLPDLFDRRGETMIRTFEVGSFSIMLHLPQPRAVRSLTLHTGSMDFSATIIGILPDGQTVEYSQSFAGLEPDPSVTLEFPGGPYQLAQLQIQINQLDPFLDHIHVRELTLNP